jgi:spermidine synthase
MSAMTSDAAGLPARTATPALFVLAAFTGAALIFVVQPMVAKLVLPQLGGSPAVWNTSMAFFQAALLAGYGYAHLLQRLPSVRAQALVHIAVLVVAGLVLPLRITTLLGEPSSTMPAAWLLGVLVVSIGAPFAALSATAPLVQAWHARVFRGERGEPYVLYAASNLGSLIALLAYPIIVEPTVTLAGQRWGWSAAYLVFVLVMASLALSAARTASPPVSAAKAEGAISWRDRLIWIALAAIPSSLMLGVTAHLATDVASAPFMWVGPLALYLLTFVIAFQTRPLLKPGLVLLVQAAILPVCVYLLPMGGDIAYQVFVHLLCFFASALVCHQALVARRPDPAHLTEFYLCLSLGGVAGGAFNAFIAPVVFDAVVEYPLMLVLAAAARPWTRRGLSFWETGVVVTGVLTALFAGVVAQNPPGRIFTYDAYDTVRAVLIATVVAAFLLRRHTPAFFGMIAVLALAAHAVDRRAEVVSSDRSFFGVMRQSRTQVSGLGGEVRMLTHGTTLHGAQARDPRYRCRPLTYYAPETPIGQVFRMVQAERAPISVAAVGLGAGTVAAYTRSVDRMTFFEIDPLVVEIATNPKNFSYTSQCARGQVGFVIGDARLTLARQPPGSYDILLVDAFSSDAIPAHLLTIEAMRIYLSRIKPDGVVVLHLSNRHLALAPAAQASARAAGGYALIQWHQAAYDSPNLSESSAEVMIVARSPQALAGFRDDANWETLAPNRTRPWTDDYTNILGALIAQKRERPRG